MDKSKLDKIIYDMCNECGECGVSCYHCPYDIICEFLKLIPCEYDHHTCLTDIKNELLEKEDTNERVREI